MTIISKTSFGFFKKPIFITTIIILIMFTVFTFTKDRIDLGIDISNINISFSKGGNINE